MSLPIKFELIDIDDYQAAMRKPQKALLDADLSHGTVRKGPFGGPAVFAGNFAAVYQLTDKKNKVHAIRCFVRLAPDAADRYARISAHLKKVVREQDRKDPFLCPIAYQAEGIVLDDVRRPITVMPWIEGETLDAYLDRAVREPYRLPRLVAQIKKLALSLRRAEVAHGDLQHRNILVDKSGAMRLVDYDGMWVPALHDRKSNEIGVADYQHPERTWEHFGQGMDRFSLIVLFLNLFAVAQHPELWAASARSEGLLLRESDYRSPDQSSALQTLASHADLRPYVTKFRRVCVAPIDQVPTLADFLRDLEVSVPPEVATGDSTSSAQVPAPATEQPAAGSSLPPIVVQTPTSDAPVVAFDAVTLDRHLGQLVTITGAYDSFSRADSASGRYRILHVSSPSSLRVDVVADPVVVEQIRATGRRWKIQPGQLLTASGLLLKEDSRYVLQLEQAASLVRGRLERQPGHEEGAARPRPHAAPSAPASPRGVSRRDEIDSFFDDLFDDSRLDDK